MSFPLFSNVQNCGLPKPFQRNMLLPSSASWNCIQVGAEVIQGSKWVDYINRLHELCPIRNVEMGGERDLVPRQQDK